MLGTLKMRRNGSRIHLDLEADIGFDESQAVAIEMLVGPTISNRYECSSDYGSILWRGLRYSFDKSDQRSVIAALLKCRGDGTDCMTEAELLAIAGSTKQHLREVFRGHSAWGAMIVPGHEHGGEMGTFRLAP